MCLTHLFPAGNTMNAPIYFTETDSPLGCILLTATSRGLCGIYFEAQKHRPCIASHWQRDDGVRFDSIKQWLRDYFANQAASPAPDLELVSGTAFQRKIWRLLQSIPAGETLTYARLAERAGSPAAVRAVGAAVGRNPVSIVIPCHRVIGSNGSLTGYAGGLERKRWLLNHEHAAGAV